MSLPVFNEFVIHEDDNVGPRWERYVQKLNNMFVAMDINNEVRKKAMLLHFVGEPVNDIVHTLQLGEGGNSENCYETLCSKLTAHFKPKTNRRIMIFKFRSAKQEESEPFEDYVLRLRNLASKCDFTDIEEEITNQLIFTIRDKKLQRKALEDNLPLEKIIDIAKNNAADRR